MNDIREHIYLAALLHDIGKFYQRADTGSVESSTQLSEHCKCESTFCPQHNGYYTHKHVLWTAQFIEDHRDIFNKLTKAVSTDHDNLMHLAAGHHLGAEQLTGLGKIIKEADCLSSGMDRDSETAFHDEQDAISGWDAFKRKKMTSILETIGKTDEELTNKTNWYHQPVKALTLENSFFANTDKGDPDYVTLWNDFEKEFSQLQTVTYRALSETLLNLLFKYTITVPASTVNFPDVSLFDHLKTTAALAVCLYDVQISEEHPNKPFLLIGADFSGIQSYIYQIVSKYAGKNLKGRSFYLRILSDAVVRYLLKKLELFQANVIYNSGGGFYILAPNTGKIKTKLKSAIDEIEHSLFKSHGTSLFVAIDSIELSKDTLLHKGSETLGEVWSKLFEKREIKKNHRFDSLVQSNYNAFFTPIQKGCDAERDVITGEELDDGKKARIGELGPLKPITAKQIDIGKALRKSDIIIVSEDKIPYWENDNEIVNLEPSNLGFTYYFIDKGTLAKKQNQLRSSADSINVITLNGDEGNCDFIDEPNLI